MNHSSSHNSFRMVSASELPQVGYWNQYASADPSGWQSSVRYEVIQRPLTDG
ncbi:MAG: hypothetical protein P4K86_11080 [Terracidiphilus sp.]|jgi:hypothetical protein|nr:hypothetical protein [Terracidiphilus sp.]MDR3776582.1 hypothetical protein [Terracidiphilus sp.]